MERLILYQKLNTVLQFVRPHNNYTRGKKISVKIKVMQGRTREKYGNKMGLKAP